MRKFYRSVFQVEILSDEPIDDGLSLGDVEYAMSDGDCSGLVSFPVHNEEVDGPTMAKLLKAQGSDPGFFMLTDEGEDDD